MMKTDSHIQWMKLNDDGELEPLIDKSRQALYIGKNSYFEYTLPYSDMKSEWNLHIIDKWLLFYQWISIALANNSSENILL